MHVKSDVVLICVKVVLNPPQSLVGNSHPLTGEELDAFLERHKPEFDRIIYVGDGSNDYCPVVRLRRCVEIMNCPTLVG